MADVIRVWTAAKFVVDVRAFTQTEQPLACLSLMINFLLPDPPAI